MANVDTEQQRRSVLGFTWALHVLPINGTIGAESRAHVAYCYSGITPDSGGGGGEPEMQRGRGTRRLVSFGSLLR